jgi:peptide deformylase
MINELDYSGGLAKPLIMDDNPLLREVSISVIDFDTNLIDLVKSMVATMFSNNGCGLSAIQIGVTKRVIVAFFETKVVVMVNPVITRTLKREIVESEGCLSIPRTKWCQVSRPAKCDVDFQDTDGTNHSISLSGRLARIIQHEIDHLNGVLIYDKVYRG